mmetsp:Transcript_16017/g.28751  ORF Transcript_16017/g.28751 Transcript_16017/m.28751 type:complete len:482 (+) Transcript_16017:88-1533(+)|eukprot:CAMPEP_0197523634 /NCGR_PEP_ID=MMETSP1318-20131121/8528_1 /TAXON_ID=552666 /ORGANISM="Partenskyella glossopodia, Strain RCC365" /LENGTH=481 /DNA_ID=CAMNT_0043076391 /DNA_START=35 /DNA_END=1476 /DNA_ORIENTATION=-
MSGRWVPPSVRRKRAAEAAKKAREAEKGESQTPARPVQTVMTVQSPDAKKVRFAIDDKVRVVEKLTWPEIRGDFRDPEGEHGPDYCYLGQERKTRLLAFYRNHLYKSVFVAWKNHVRDVRLAPEPHTQPQPQPQAQPQQQSQPQPQPQPQQQSQIQPPPQLIAAAGSTTTSSGAGNSLTIDTFGSARTSSAPIKISRSAPVDIRSMSAGNVDTSPSFSSSHVGADKSPIVGGLKAEKKRSGRIFLHRPRRPDKAVEKLRPHSFPKEVIQPRAGMKRDYPASIQSPSKRSCVLLEKLRLGSPLGGRAPRNTNNSNRGGADGNRGSADETAQNFLKCAGLNLSDSPISLGGNYPTPPGLVTRSQSMSDHFLLPWTNSQSTESKSVSFRPKRKLSPPPMLRRHTDPQPKPKPAVPRINTKNIRNGSEGLSAPEPMLESRSPMVTPQVESLFGFEVQKEKQSQDDERGRSGAKQEKRQPFSLQSS